MWTEQKWSVSNQTVIFIPFYAIQLGRYISVNNTAIEINKNRPLMHFRAYLNMMVFVKFQ